LLQSTCVRGGKAGGGVRGGMDGFSTSACGRAASAAAHLRRSPSSKLTCGVEGAADGVEVDDSPSGRELSRRLAI